MLSEDRQSLFCSGRFTAYSPRIFRLRKRDSVDFNKVSVIVPVYNAERFLGETLGSIRSQSFQDFEIICVDDASTDRSLDVLRELSQQDDRIRIIELGENSGAGASINAGLDAARGDFIQIVGNDDLLDREALAFLYERCAEESLDFIQYGVSNFLDDPSDPDLRKRSEVKERYHRIAHPYPVGTGLEILKLAVENGEYRMTNGPQFVRRSLLENNGIRNLPGVQHEDMYFTYRIFLAAKRCTIDPRALYHYRIRSGSQEAGKGQHERVASECYSLLRSAEQMAMETPDEIYFSPEYAQVMDETIHRYYSAAARMLLRMPPDFRFEVDGLETKIGCAASAILAECAQDAWRIRDSYSYRLGHAILAPFYKLTKKMGLKRRRRIR